MTSIRQTKKYGKKLVAKGFILILGKQRNRHYTRVYKRFHASVKNGCPSCAQGLHGKEAAMSVDYSEINNFGVTE